MGFQVGQVGCCGRSIAPVITIHMDQHKILVFGTYRIYAFEPRHVLSNNVAF